MRSEISSRLVFMARGLRELGFEFPGKGRPLLRTVLIVLFLPPCIIYVWLILLPWPMDLRWRVPARTSFIEFRVEEARDRGEALEVHQEWLPLDRISANVRRAVLVAEDDRFYLHGGIDWKALGEEVGYRGDTVFSWWDLKDLRALKTSLGFAWKHRDQIRGRSTITQQLAKNLYFSPDRSILRKAGEAVVAKRLEGFLSKDRILEIYLNVAEWGPGIFGVQAAARAYFGRDAGDLTLSQAAALAATLPHPLTSNPSFRPGRMEWRRNFLLGRLRGPPAPPEAEPFLPDSGEPSAPDSGALVFPDTLLPSSSWGVERREDAPVDELRGGLKGRGHQVPSTYHGRR